MRQLIANGKMNLDRYCLFYSWIVNADFFLHHNIIVDPLTLVLKYEDFVYDKGHVVNEICNWFNLDIPAQRLSEIVAHYAGIPVAEQPDQHIRQAHPGDHRRKLKPETIAALNGVLAEFMATFGYQAE